MAMFTDVLYCDLIDEKASRRTKFTSHCFASAHGNAMLEGNHMVLTLVRVLPSVLGRQFNLCLAQTYR